MKRKRMIKGLMACGIPRNEANLYAGACSGKLPHLVMGKIVLAYPNFRLTTAMMMACGCRQLHISLQDAGGDDLLMSVSYD